jgi:hypothetical protein
VPVARIVKRSEEINSLYFNTKQIVTNSQLLVFYSQQVHATFYANATNWNSSGYWEEIYPETCKFTVNVLQTIPWYEQDSITMNNSNSFI